MITNSNVSKISSSEEYVDIKKYVGVGSISIVAINPNNAKLREFGWTIPEGTQEPVYACNKAENKPGRVRFLVQLQDPDDKPVLALDFWIRPDARITGKEGDAVRKCQVIDSFGRTAFATKEELKAHKIPQYKNGPAQIAANYKPCHSGEADLVQFLMKFLNVTPLQRFDRAKNMWIDNKAPGELTIDHWDKLCNGDVSELAEYVSLRPDNRVKVIFGVKTTDENRNYQTFMSSMFLGNGAFVSKTSGVYDNAQKEIDRFLDSVNPDSPVSYTYSAAPVRVWEITASQTVEDNSDEDMPDFENAIDDEDSLPFE